MRKPSNVRDLPNIRPTLTFHKAVLNIPSLDFFFQVLTEAELFYQQYYNDANDQLVCSKNKRKKMIPGVLTVLITDSYHQEWLQYPSSM